MLKNILSDSSFQMLQFEHETLLQIVDTLLKCAKMAQDLAPEERAYWENRISGLLDMCEADGEILKLTSDLKIAQQASLKL